MALTVGNIILAIADLTFAQAVPNSLGLEIPEEPFKAGLSTSRFDKKSRFEHNTIKPGKKTG
jgi:hypothetical protein